MRGGEPLLRPRGTIGSRSLYGKVRMRQLHGNSIIIAVSGSGHTGTQINYFDAVIHMQESPARTRFSVGCSSAFMRRSQHLMAPDAWCNQCLPGRLTPDVLRPGIVGMRGCLSSAKRFVFTVTCNVMNGLWSYDFGHAWHEYPPPGTWYIYYCAISGIWC